MRKILSLSVVAFCFMAGTSFASSVVATIFPIYDWVREISNENLDLTLLLDYGVDLHSYQPTVDDIVKISKSDVFIYVGGESDEWVEDVLKNSLNKNQIVINLLEVLGENVKHEEIVEGMEHEHHDHEAELDEHVWLSLRNAEFLCGKIAEVLSKIDPDNKETYSKNLSSYIEKLKALDNEYEAAINYSKRKVILFGDRFPFRYLADDYGLKYYAAFSGCSAETEASFETIVFLSGKVDELNLPSVLTIDGTRHKIAETVIANTKSKTQKIISLNSMQSTTMKDIKNGAKYLSIMKANLKNLKQALN